MNSACLNDVCVFVETGIGRRSTPAALGGIKNLIRIVTNAELWLDVFIGRRSKRQAMAKSPLAVPWIALAHCSVAADLGNRGQNRAVRPPVVVGSSETPATAAAIHSANAPGRKVLSPNVLLNK
mmetsp:Transcript_26121/g.52326  ORF Transcript_26121/g.52326 Transcript_26121/m.52326 type:complete len:124 (-) Transcript_26121:3484-3855(-)